MPPLPGWLGVLIDEANVQKRRARARERLRALGVRDWDVKFALEGVRPFRYIVRKYRRRIKRRASGS